MFDYRPTKWADHYQPRCNPAKVLRLFRMGMISELELEVELWDSCGINYDYYMEEVSK